MGCSVKQPDNFLLGNVFNSSLWHGGWVVLYTISRFAVLSFLSQETLFASTTTSNKLLCGIRFA